MVLFSPIRRIRNTKRKFLPKKFDYVYLEFPTEFSNREPPPKPFLQRLIFPDSIFTIEHFEFEIEKYVRSSKGKGLIIELPLQFFLPFGVINQFHSILRPIKESGREIIVIGKQFDIKAYYFAMIADRIFLIPGGILDVRGLSSSIQFYKSSLEKLGLKFEKIAVSGYKSAFDNFARDEIAPESKENIQWLLKGELDLIKDTVTSQRDIKDFSSFLDNAPYLDSDALRLNYVDGLLRPDELPNELKNPKNPKIRIIPFHRLHKALPIFKGKNSNETIAIIPVNGVIMDGYSRTTPFKLPFPVPLVDEDQTGDMSILNVVREIYKDSSVVGAILFIDSPGGSVLASETIRSALENLNKKIPVIAYFNSVSASGGYYISTATRWIVSEPGCITGSIGVISGRISMKDFFDKYEINIATIKEGKNADWGNIHNPFTDEERESTKKFIDNVYDRFLNYVAENRNKSKEEVTSLAGGRVYTGIQAFNNGLVDQLGSLQDAYLKICEMVKKKPNLEMITYHPSKASNPPNMISKSLNFSERMFQTLINYYEPYFGTNYWMRDFNLFLS